MEADELHEVLCDYGRPAATRQWKASHGTLGGFPAAVMLDKMLLDRQDMRLLSRVTRVVHAWENKSKKIADCVIDCELRREVMDIYYKSFVERAMGLSPKASDEALKTHLVCVLSTIKKKAMANVLTRPRGSG